MFLEAFAIKTLGKVFVLCKYGGIIFTYKRGVCNYASFARENGKHKHV